MALSNSQFDAIMRVYNQRQFLNKRRQDERIREVYERIPQVEALTDEIAATMAQAARKKLLGDEDGARALKEEASLLKEQKRKYLQRAGYPDDYMEMQYHCSCCRDTGFADGKKCRCFRQMEIQVLYDQSNIREVLERENFDTLSMEYYDRERIDGRVGMTVYDYMSMVIGECRAYVENFGREKGSILFTGSTGCGKTFLSNCIARELLRQCYSVVYLTATDMFDILSESRFGGRDEEEVRDRAAYILDCDHRRPGDGAHQHLYGLPALLLYQREAHEKAGNHYLHQPGPEPDAGRIYGTGHLPDHEPVQGPAPSGRGSQASAARLWETRLTKWRILL